MTDAAKTAGYVITDRNNEIIYGVGDTVDAAWNMIVQDGLADRLNADGEPMDRDEVYEKHFRSHPATAALIAEVYERGGNISWGRVGRVLCTIAEEEATLGA